MTINIIRHINIFYYPICSEIYYFIMSNNYISLCKAMNYKTFMGSIMNTGKIITELRKSKDWSQTDLAGKSGVSREMIGKYERDEAVPSIEAAKKIADAFDVSLDYLVGVGVNSKLDKRNLKRIEELELLEDEKKKTLFDLMDTYIRDAKARKAFAS
jgi:transcriptional regulator with XRE-family HTH domain